MNHEMRPRSFGDIFDHSFQLYTDRFWLLTGISAVIWIPVGLMLAFGHLAHLQLAWLADQTWRAGLPVIQMAITYAVANTYLDSPVDITDCYEPIFPLLFRIGITELLLLIFVIVAFVLLVLPGIYVLVAWSLVPQVMMVERRWGRDALKRSENLVKGVWWQTCWMGLILLLIGESFADYTMTWWKVAPLTGPLATSVILSVVCGYTCSVVAVYYFDRRCRSEGYNLQMLAEELGYRETTRARLERTPRPV
ncbi:MAG TPA: hypothetical protein VLL57_00100 [Candidatus Binataceae bacterium]|nr:hypothetical protein [Candidatus Binataceae bacterium]